MSPYKDRAKRRAATLEWMKRRRAEWLAAHPCACGAPATMIVSTPESPGKVTWSRSWAALLPVLAGKRTICEACKAAEREARAEAKAERHREHNRNWRAKAAGRPPKDSRGAGGEPRPGPADNGPDPDGSTVPSPPRGRRPAPEPLTSPEPQVARRGRPRAPAPVVTVFDDPEWRRQRAEARMARRRAMGMTEAEPVDDDG